jgi:3-keto-disaccharide hydrolase
MKTAILSILSAAALCAAAVLAQSPPAQWTIHDMNRPVPQVVEPGPPGEAVPAPSDAIVLLNGQGLAAWRMQDGQPAKWKVDHGYAEVVKGTGTIQTKEGFGDCQLHVEWMAPSPAVGDGQERGNSGVYLMSQYEVQVLDSYKNRTYADGLAAAIYGQFPPLLNASRPPGQWQTYDIVFHRPRFDAAGTVMRPARMTILHNGVLVQDNVELTGPTAHKARPPYKAHADKLPLQLQDHDHPVRYRNIWIRELGRS